MKTRKLNYEGVYGESPKQQEGWGNVLAAVFLLGLGFCAGATITAFIMLKVLG